MLSRVTATNIRIHRREGRRIPLYDEDSKEIYRYDADICKIQVKRNHKTKKSVIYNNQGRCAELICHEFANPLKLIGMVIGLTQIGKTGAMVSTIQKYTERNYIPIDNIYIITGLSSADWIEQTKARFPECVSDRIFHRNSLLKKELIEEISQKKNVLIIMDEVQIAAKEKQTISNLFLRCGLCDKRHLLENDIKIIEFSATPDGTLYDVHDWGDSAFTIKMEAGEGYIGCRDLIELDKVFQYKDLRCHDNSTGSIDIDQATENIQELKHVIDQFGEPMYHIVRVPCAEGSDDVINNFKRVFGEDMDYHLYNCDTEITITRDGKKIAITLNELLDTKPTKHIFIFIKERLRCAKTISKKYIGVMYERFVYGVPGDSVIVQGLVGRITGYDYNGVSVCFTNIDSIERYIQLCDSSFQDKSIKWNSGTTRRVKGELTSSGTFNQSGEKDSTDQNECEKNENHHSRFFKVVPPDDTTNLAHFHKKIWTGVKSDIQKFLTDELGFQPGDAKRKTANNPWRGNKYKNRSRHFKDGRTEEGKEVGFDGENYRYMIYENDVFEKPFKGAHMKNKGNIRYSICYDTEGNLGIAVRWVDENTRV